LELIIAAPGTLQQSRNILRNLADNDLTLSITTPTDGPGRNRTAAGPNHTRAALILAAAIIWAARHRR
ncbi:MULTISPECIES: hypothetical protein, partial [unclassified Kitasatospora]|uniref:hypothetical protein n=1 Tax=unclassified Kitasatospora TaxID=2633591 RepID=UPI00381F584A